MASASENLYNKIDTFIFFDLETTDLIKGSKMPKITELSMVATDRNSIKCEIRNKLALPRILHKLTIPICPMQSINSEASYITNLWNDSLENIKPFDENTYNMIMQFIERLPGLVCFVAHNGNHFDYPVFLSEIQQLKKSLPDKILCVDTLLAFKEFFNDMQSVIQEPAQIIPEGRDEVDEEILASLECTKSVDLLQDEWNDVLCSTLDNFEKTQIKQQNISKSSESICENGKDVLDSISNENQSDVNNSHTHTPKSSPKSMQAINEKTPESQIIKNSTGDLIKILHGVRKKLNFSDNKPKNYKLCTLHLHLIGCRAKESHCAEADCLSMLRCVCQIGPYFAEWADYNAVSLNLFKKKQMLQ